MAAIRAMPALVQGTPLASLLVADRGARWALVRAREQVRPGRRHRVPYGELNRGSR